jgi:hypothetical protein
MAREPTTPPKACDQVVNSFQDCITGEDNCQRVKVSSLLDKIRLLASLGVLASCESLVETAGCGEKKRDLLRRFRLFRDGAPSDSHLGAIFGALHAERLRRCFIFRVPALTGLPGNMVHGDIAGVETRRPPSSPAN